MKNAQNKVIKRKGKTDRDDVEIGKNLRSFRNLRGISQQTAGDAIGVTFQQIQKYENGTNRVSATTLSKFAEFFEVDVRLLLGSMPQSKDYSLPKIDAQTAELLRLLEDIKDKRLLTEILNVVRSISKARAIK